MRKFIFKDEIENIFHQRKIQTADRQMIIECLFSNTGSIDRRRQYYLKLKFQIISDITEILKQTIGKPKIEKEIANLFIINDDLHIPIELKKKLMSGEPVAIFIGAGVSKLIGYPLWGELADMSIQHLVENGFINHFEKEKLLKEGDPKFKLSIFKKFCIRQKPNWKVFFEKHLRFPNNRNSNRKSNPYDKIVSSHFKWIKLTSNVDYELRDALRRLINGSGSIGNQSDKTINSLKNDSPVEVVSKDFNVNELSTDKLYYLHGELDNLSETIFTTEDYVKTYFKSGKGTLRDFLENLFKKYTVVFVGYGLEEFPILETIIGKRTKGKAKNIEGNRHFALMGTYLNEMNFFNIKQQYFDSLNISIIPYYLDFDGYGRLFTVLENWEQEIQTDTNNNYLDVINFIDKVL